jgi:hypothetical protein
MARGGESVEQREAPHPLWGEPPTGPQPVEIHIARWSSLNNLQRILVIQELTAVEFGITVADLRSRDKHRRISWPRCVAIALSRQFSSAYFAEIGRLFGGMHHTAVIRASRVAGKILKKEPRISLGLRRISVRLLAYFEPLEEIAA